MGLSGAVPLLLAGRVGYKEQALFSIASLPFSLKLLWAPFVDAAYARRAGADDGVAKARERERPPLALPTHPTHALRERERRGVENTHRL